MRLNCLDFARMANAKAKGIRLGNPNLKTDNCKRIKKAIAYAERLRGIVVSLIDSGLTQRQIVEQLNRSGVKTAILMQWAMER